MLPLKCQNDLSEGLYLVNKSLNIWESMQGKCASCCREVRNIPHPKSFLIISHLWQFGNFKSSF
jgi:hypothetical protein